MQKNVKDFVVEKGRELQALPMSTRVKNVIEMVRKKFDVELTFDAVRNVLRRMVDDLSDKIQAANDAVGDDEAYEFRDSVYVLRTKHGAFSITLEQADAIFMDFSKKGKDMSSEAILKKYSLKPEVWHAIKNKLRLYKDSHTFSPETVKHLSPEELDGKVEEAVGAHIDAVKEKMVKTHDRVFKQRAHSAFKILSNVENFLAHVRSYLANYVPEPIDYVPAEKVAPGRVSVFLSDFHIGKRGTSDIIDRLSAALDECVAAPEGEIDIYSLGDLAETLSPILMHDSQIGALEDHGVFPTMLKIADLFRRFLAAVAKSGKRVTFHGIGGNHDRITKGHDQDMSRTGALVIYEFIRLGLAGTDVKVNYYLDKVNTIECGNLAYVIHHGDDGFSDRKIEDVLWKNGVAGKYNLVMHGDKHAISMRETKAGMMICVPALAGEGDYDKRLDLHSQPAIIVVRENAKRTADVLLKRL
jgi:hypothetical protein